MTVPRTSKGLVSSRFCPATSAKEGNRGVRSLASHGYLIVTRFVKLAHESEMNARWLPRIWCEGQSMPRAEPQPKIGQTCLRGQGMRAEISHQWKQWGKWLMSTLSQDCHLKR